ncbi:MAG: enoyl-CoA hydratase-related protein [Pyrinomonadaceae bacterium]
MSELLTKTENGVLQITLNRPEKRNALNDALISGLKNAFVSARDNAEIHAVLIRGAGNDFCSGADLSALQKIAQSSITENLEDAESLAELFLLIREFPRPVVAAVHGNALAGGCGLATACDLVLASDDALFGYPEVKIGFVPAIVMAILRRNISEKRSFELITKGFSFTAQEALEMGLINRVFPASEFESAALDYVSDFGKTSLSAVELSKKLLYQMDGLSFESSMKAGSEINAIARMTEDCQRGIARFLDKK